MTKIKWIVFIFFFVLTCNVSSFAQPATTSHQQSHLIQKIFPGLADRTSEWVVIEMEASILVPYSQFRDTLKTHTGIVGKPLNHVIVNGQEGQLVPYLVIPQGEYRGFLSRQNGIKNKDPRFIIFGGVETVTFSSTEVNSDISYYAGIQGSPARHVNIDGIHTICVLEDEYRTYTQRASGLAGWPSNYIMEGQTLMMLLPINRADYGTQPPDQIRSQLDTKSTTTGSK